MKYALKVICQDQVSLFMWPMHQKDWIDSFKFWKFTSVYGKFDKYQVFKQFQDIQTIPSSSALPWHSQVILLSVSLPKLLSRSLALVHLIISWKTKVFYVICSHLYYFLQCFNKWYYILCRECGYH